MGIMVIWSHYFVAALSLECMLYLWKFVDIWLWKVVVVFFLLFVCWFI